MKDNTQWNIGFMFLCSFFVLKLTLVSQLWDRNFVQPQHDLELNVTVDVILPWECRFCQFLLFLHGVFNSIISTVYQRFRGSNDERILGEVMMKRYWIVPADLKCCDGWHVHVAVVGYQAKH